MARDILDGWENLPKREQLRRRRRLAEEYFSLLNTCKNQLDCNFIALKLALIKINHPGDCPDPSERLAMQLLASHDPRDLEFLVALFPNLKTSQAAEAQLATLKCPG